MESDEEDLRSRSDARRERKASEDALATLADALVRLPPKQRGSLELPELLEDAIEEAARMPNPRARARQLRVVRRELRDGPHEVIADRLDALLHPHRRPSLEARAAAAWVDRLGESDDLEAFMAEHPRADRQRLRTLIRNHRKAKEGPRAKKARAALVAAIEREMVAHAADDADEAEPADE